MEPLGEQLGLWKVLENGPKEAARLGDVCSSVGEVYLAAGTVTLSLTSATKCRKQPVQGLALEGDP